jgi:hypothetical protein
MTNDITEPPDVDAHFNININLRDAIDRIPDTLAGTQAQKQAKLFSIVKTLAKKFDLTFTDTWSLIMSRHPALRQDEDLKPQAYVPQLKTITQTKQAEREAGQKRQEQEKQEVVSSVAMTRVRAIQASDPSKSFVDAYDDVMMELRSLRDYGDISPAKVPAPTLEPVPPPPVARPQVVQATQNLPAPVSQGRMTRIHGEEDPSGEAYLLEGAIFCPVLP